MIHFKKYFMWTTLIMFVGLASLKGVYAKNFYNTKKKNVVISGYDAVAYFTENKAVLGKKKYALKHDDAIWWFSSEKNRKLFKKNPQKYRPAYGGWCAYAIGKHNKKVQINPKTFKIKGGKLYLFYNKFGQNTLKMWNKDETNLFDKAEKNWGKMVKQ